jgi:SAM-dependent methyltransferase
MQGQVPAGPRELKGMKKRLLMAVGLAAALAVSYFVIDAVNERRLSGTFNRIYADGTWGRDVAGRGTSGTGSTLAITEQYRAYIEDFIKTHDVRSVVDAGCGDWGFSSAIEWGEASYLGVDIASDVIATVRRRHESDKIRFQVGDITDDLPAADLLISKDVLQHLSNSMVGRFISNNLRPGKYKWVILTNDRGSGNPDVASGGYRTIDLAAPPFEVKGLVDLPITFGNEITKITSLLDLTQAR